MTNTPADLKRQFASIFGDGGRIHVVRAPGRVNLIGEHTDYNDGFVFPMAIEPEVLFVCRSHDDGGVRIATTFAPGEIAEFSVQGKITRGEPRWANYSKGVAAELLAAGIPLTGMDALIVNTLPVGGGLSSSAAIEVGTGTCLLKLAGLGMDPMRLALLCQKAEHEYALVPCGIMDQMIVATARVGHATLFDCRTQEKRYVPLDSNELRVLIVNSMVRHELTGGEYAERRRQCEQGVAFFQKERPAVKALRDISLKQLEAAQGQLPGVIYRRCRHVVSENLRTTEAASALQQRHYERAGELMIESHASMRDDYEISCPELDFLADEATKIKGVYGARMTGGGFGGCIVALCRPSAVDDATARLRERYQEKFDIDPVAFVTTATAAANVVE